MKKILLLGAGRSSTILIEYLKKECENNDWQLIVADQDKEVIEEKTRGSDRCIPLQVHNVVDELDSLLPDMQLVISMLPASLHIKIAHKCVANKVNLLTASYVSDEMNQLDSQVKEAGLLFMNECGLDPGIDHMSGVKVLDRLREEGWTIHGFETFTGGLLAPSNEDNPWHYKFTWNPRNVVMAGQGGVKFFQEGRYKYIPYHRLFTRTEVVHIPGFGYFEGYANRDSLKYREIYGLEDIQTMYRGTFRRPGYCKTWDIFVQLGATDDSYELEDVASMTHRDFINTFLFYNPSDSVELKLAHYMKIEMESEEMYKLKWLGVFEQEPIGLDKGTPAQVLEHILKKKWTLNDTDNDMIVMWHKFNYHKGDGHMKEYHSTMVALGEDKVNTGMAKTVGLPMGIVAKLMLQDKISLKGVHIPIHGEIYNPVLKELEELGFHFIEEEID